MKKMKWRFVLSVYLIKYGYEKWYRPIRAFLWSGDECWIQFYDEDYSPKEAILEDLSYA